jgi:ribosomal protein S18 acetylase RimI-like enzyme
MPGYAVRPPVTADLDALLELHWMLQDHLEGANPQLWTVTAEARRNLRGQLAARLRAAESCCVVAIPARVLPASPLPSSEQVVGMAFGRLVLNKSYTPARTGSIDQLFVHPEHRRRGLGSCLVGELCRFFAALAVDDISLRYVHGNQEAAAFWQAIGFAPRIVTVGANLAVVMARLAAR